MGALKSKLTWNPGRESLDASGTNDAILDNIFRILNHSCNDHVSLANDVSFTKPLEFYTRLTPPDYLAAEDSKEYVVREEEGTCTSTSHVGDMAALTLQRLGESSFEVKIRNLWLLRSHLRLAGRFSVESRRREIAVILECEKNILWTLTGSKLPLQEQVEVLEDSGSFRSRGATPSSEVEMDGSDQELPVDIPSGRASALSERGKRIERLQYLRLLNAMEDEIITSSETHEETVADAHAHDENALPVKAGLTIKEVNAEIQSLQYLCGTNETKRGLRFLHWESEYEYASSGSYAPPWRAPKGETGYVLAGTFDKGVIVITCTFNGYFINKGYYVDASGKECLNYDASSRVYPSLSALLEDNSTHFSDALRLAEAGEVFSESDEDDVVSIVANRENDSVKEGGLASRPELSTQVSSISLSPNRQRARSDIESSSRRLRHQRPTSGTARSKERRRGSETPRSVALRKLVSSGSLRDVKSMSSRPSSAMEKAGRNSRPSSATSHTAKRRGIQEDTKPDKDESDDDGADEDEGGYINPDICPNYNNIHRIVTRSLITKDSSTLIYGLCQLQDMDLMDGVNQLALLDVGGMKPLLDLLSLDDTKVVVGAAQVIRTISTHPRVQSAIAKLHGVRPIVAMLAAAQDIVRVLGAQILVNLANHARACYKMQKSQGVEALINALEESTRTLANVDGSGNGGDPNHFQLMTDLALSSANALRRAAKADTVKTLVRTYGGVAKLSALMSLAPPALLVPLAGIILECTEDIAFREELQASDCIRMLVQYLNAPSSELRALCGEAICRCAVDGQGDSTTSSVRAAAKAIQTKDVLAPLVSLLSSTDKPLLVSATAAIQKSLSNETNVGVFLTLGGPSALIQALLNSPYEEVQVNVTGAIWNVAKVPSGRGALRTCGAAAALVELLRKTSIPLLINVTGAIGACAMDTALKVAIAEADGLRLLWSLLRLNHPKVQANAAGAICPLLDHPKNLAMVGEQLTGGLQLLVDLLKSTDEDVQSNVCAAIANVAKAEYALAVLSEQGVLPELAQLASRCGIQVRKNLACAISQCCSFGDNRSIFGELNGVSPLVRFLEIESKDVLRATVLAMLQLTEDPQNALTLRGHGAVKKLVKLLSSTDDVLQDMAAGTLANIRAVTLNLH